MLLVSAADALPFPDATFQTIITSPPYWKARDYGHGPDQLGFEDAAADYIANLVATLREAHRVLCDDGVLWINIGDSYNTRAKIRQGPHNPGLGHTPHQVGTTADMPWAEASAAGLVKHSSRAGSALKDKDLALIPSRFAIAMTEAGWYLRAEVIWTKPWGKPERAPDRPSVRHEKIFMLTKQQHYYYDKTVAAAIGAHRTVWEIPPAQGGDGPAVFPDTLVERCMLPTTRPGDAVLDPFCGSGTTAAVADRHHRRGFGTDLTDRWFPTHRHQQQALPIH